MNQKIPLIIITGPTAVGKTELSVRLYESENSSYYNNGSYGSWKNRIVCKAGKGNRRGNY